MKKYLKEKYNWFKKEENLRKLFLAVVLAACVFEFISIKTDKRNIESTLYESKHNWKEVRKNESVPDIKEIQPWMTFNYLNFLFKLPKDYLENNLNINTQKYPNISIQRYAKINNTNLNDFISKIKLMIENYNTSSR